MQIFLLFCSFYLIRERCFFGVEDLQEEPVMPVFSQEASRVLYVSFFTRKKLLVTLYFERYLLLFHLPLAYFGRHQLLDAYVLFSLGRKNPLLGI